MKVEIIILAAFLLFSAGCAAGQQAKDDYVAGRTSATQEEQQKIQSTAGMVGDAVGSVLPIARQPVVLLLSAFGFWKLGRKKRKGLPPSDNPIFGYGGAKFGIEALIQAGANIVSGIYDHGKTGSVGSGLWKLAATGGLAGLLMPAVVEIPKVQELLVQNQGAIVGIFASIAATVAAVENMFHKVKPVKEEKPAPAPAG